MKITKGLIVTFILLTLTTMLFALLVNQATNRLMTDGEKILTESKALNDDTEKMLREGCK